VKAQLDANTSKLAALEGAIAAMAAGTAAQAAALVPAVAVGPFGSFGAPAVAQAAPVVQAVPAGVDGDAITALISPHVDNPAVKDALGAEMRAMGINALPETQPGQFPEMYARFAAVIARFQANPAPAAPTNLSII
jgi:hypothetical protein